MYIAVFQSMSIVNKVKRYLAQRGEAFEMIHSPACISKGGCSFSLRFEEREMEILINALRELGINAVEIFREVIADGVKNYDIWQDARR